jgi:hypothetical protein
MRTAQLMTLRLLFIVIVGLLTAGLLLPAEGPPPALRVGHFSAQSPSRTVPEGWKQIRFGQNESSTRYDLVRRDSTVVVRARSENGASGLFTQQRVDLEKYPILEWRWKATDLPARADVTADTTADAAARLYVTFDYDDLGVFDRVKLMLLRRVAFSEAPSRALNYLWATRQEEGTPVTSPYTDQIRMLPVRSGTTRVGEWVQERRNVRADYRAVFGEDPPAVNGIAIMTDADNTGGTARALYGDIVFRAAADTTVAKGAGR